MDEVFHNAVALILTGDLAGLAALLAADPTLVVRRSSCSHPTLLQMVAVDAAMLPDALGCAKVLVEAGADLQEPLVAAASVDAREVLLYLLTLGIDVDGEGDWTPLDEAVYWSHLELAAVLRGRGAKLGTLRVAAGVGELDAVMGFFEDDSLVGTAGPIRSPFADTVPADRANVPADIIDNAFVMAVNNGHWPVAEALLARGAHINAVPPGYHWRGTALHAACWRGDRELVERLLAAGADRTLRDGLANSDAAGWAQHHGHIALADFLRSEVAETPLPTAT